MERQTVWTLLLSGLLVVSSFGCEGNSTNSAGDVDQADDPEQTDNEVVETDTEEVDESRLVDTEGFEATPCGDIWGEAAIIKNDYGDSYASGPFGFKTSLCWEMNDQNQGSFSWGGAGDILPDFCLPDHEDNEVCMSDFYQSEYDLLILDFSAGWCPVCHAGARQAQKWKKDLVDAGWNPIIVHILGNNYNYNEQGPPTLADAQRWKKQYPKSEYVLYDPNIEWVDAATLDMWMEGRRDPTVVGFPFYYYVHTSNMRVWDTWAGFPDGLMSPYKPWVNQEIQVLDYIAEQPFAIGP